MSIEVAVGSQLGEALQNVVLPKLVELGWSTGMQDDTLSEYIILMLANGKTQEQIATELSNDLLDSGPDDPAPAEFAKWLFEQAQVLNTQFNGPAITPGDSANNGAPVFTQDDTAGAGDADMGDSADGAQGVIPTGPKAMRNGPKAGRDKRMLGQLNKSLDRSSDAALHRIRGSAGTGRINSHSREPPKGPRQQNLQRSLAAQASRPMPGMPNMPMNPMGPMQNGPGFQQPMIGMDPNTVQQMMAMMEQQAQMMAQLASGNMPGFQQPGQFKSNGRSLFDRVDKRSGKQGHGQDRRQHNSGQAQGQQDTVMGGEDNQQPKEDGADGAEKPQRDSSQIMCRFNLRCTNVDCPYAHQSPAAPQGIAVDTTVECAHGVACKNHRCSSRHPSPAKKFAHQAQIECKFGPRCQNPTCPFSHPDKGACKNGADCNVPECPYWHNPVTCKFPECTNPKCPFKHNDGQKKAPYRNNSLILNGEKKDHVSERKFVENEGEEELILPGKQMEAMDADVQVTT